MPQKKHPAPLALGLAALSLALAASGLSAAAAPKRMAHDLYGDPAHPNLAGMWNPDQAGSYRGLGTAKLTPAYAAKFAETQKAADVGAPPRDSVTRCLAFGLPRFMTMPMELIQTPSQLTLNLGVLHDIRRVYIDGRGHTPDADPSFSGDTIGHWDKDTLVAETTGLREGTFDTAGMPFSDKLTVVERFRSLGPDKIEDKIVFTDPEAFQEPYVVTRTYSRMPAGSRFEEFICERNKD
jgi:hypothetical protein